jgi:hypothetical protein
VEGVVPQRVATKNALYHLTFNIVEALVHDATNLAPPAVGLRIVFGEADPPLANAKMQRIVYAITNFFSV